MPFIHDTGAVSPPTLPAPLPSTVGQGGFSLHSLSMPPGSRGVLLEANLEILLWSCRDPVLSHSSET